MTSLACDTGPLNYLIQIDAVECLSLLCRGVIIPPSVYSEIAAAEAPPQVRAWSNPLPPWCSIQPPKSRLDGQFKGLSETDLDVLSLASETNAAVLIDDLAARKAAKRIGLPLIGTLGILELAAKRNLLSLPEAISRLRKTNIRLREDLYQEVLLRNGFQK